MTTLGRPQPLGKGEAAKEAHSIAAPLLVAAALSLAGVVAGASPKTFLWPGPTLLVLVATSLALVASIQLHYHARQYYYSRQEIDDWAGPEIDRQTAAYRLLCIWQGDDFATWRRFIRWSALCFNAGTLMLGIGVSLALAPPSNSEQAVWRWVAVVMVLLCTLTDAVWTLRLYNGRRKDHDKRGDKLNELLEKTGERI
jgi:hypothetical protein